jgi:NAD-dependent SIR2 family protein deacetylase
VFTSNVDTAFARAGLGGRASLYEIHGNIRTWQCSGPCPRSLRAARADGDAPGTWQLPASHRFAVELGSMRAPATRPAAADAGGGAEREAEPNHVSCAHCGRLARPAILMFDDERCIETAPDAYEQWEARVLGALRRDPSKRLVILEGGCGPRVPTVRRNSERLLKATAAYGTKLIRINLDFPDVRQALARHCVPIRGRVLPALEMIDRAVCARLGIASVARPSGPPSSSDSETLTVRLGALRGGE